MIYPKDPKFVFLHIAKSGGTSITKTLADFLHIDRDEYRKPAEKFIKIEQLVHPKISYVDWSDYYIFSCVRNPFDRLVSYFHYRQQIRKPPHNIPLTVTFEDWVKSGDFRELTRMTDQLCVNGQVSDRIDYIARLETITLDWPIICIDLGIDVPLIHDKKSKHKSYQELYSYETKKIVQDFYKDDLQVFEYEF